MHPGDDKQRLRGISRAQNQFLPPAPGSEQPLFPSLPKHTPAPIQARPRQHNLGLQAHDAKRGRHRPPDFAQALAEHRAERGRRPQLLPDVSDGHFAARVLRCHGYVAHGRAADARHDFGVHFLACRGGEG